MGNSLTDQDLKTLVDFTKLVKKKNVDLCRVSEIIDVDLETLLKESGVSK